MDNVIAIEAAIADLQPEGDDALKINYAKALVAKAVAQQAAAVDSRGRMYSRSSVSRAASSAARHAGDATVANLQNCPPPQPRQQQVAPALSINNGPRPERRFTAANGQPIDARQHIINDQQWRAGQPHDLRHMHSANRAHRDSYGDAPQEPTGSLSRVGPKCFGPMVRGEHYPVPFRAPKEIEKYDPSQDPNTWIESYLMAMGIAGHSDLLAARYLPLMMDGGKRQWINTLPPNSIDSWEDMRLAFIKHFEGSYSHATTVEDLERCIQGRNESTRSWVRRWQELWMHAYDIHPQLVIHCFKNSCRYEPLVAKFKRDSDLVKTVADAITIGKRYAEEDPNQGSDDDRDRFRRSTRSDDRRSEMRYSSTRQTGSKRRNDYGSDLVANANSSPQDGKSSRYGGSGGNRPYKKFNADSLLDQPCVYHNREGFPCKHTMAECYSLKKIEKARRAKGNNGNNGHNRRNDKNKGPDPAQERNADPGFGRDAGALHTFISIDNRREKKVLARAVSVNSVAVDTPRYLNWSEQPIQWTREDHPPRVEYPGRCALIVRPKVTDYWLSKTLMDGGSTINILYYDTFRRLGLNQSVVEAPTAPSMASCRVARPIRLARSPCQ
jgi:hypothetical protein